MTTVDNLLLKITNSMGPTLHTLMSTKEAKILYNFASTITNHIFITENQSKLLIKILRENSEKLPEFKEEITQVLSDPIWTRHFRVIEEVKKLYLADNEQGEISIIIECSFNAKIRSILHDLSKKCENLTQSINGKKYYAELTEKNIVAIMDALAPYNFDVDDTIKSHYNTIKSWKLSIYQDQFLAYNITNQNFQKHVTADLDINNDVDRNVIIDRSIRYQFLTDAAKNYGDSLTEVIANRPKSKIWIDSKQHTLADVMASLIELRRLPVLIVFDTVITGKYYDNLKQLSEALEVNNVCTDIGVYFRLPNDVTGKQFNQLIAEKSYNKLLDNNSKVVAVQSGKLPKFFLKNAWKPMSVIALDSRMGMRHGKTAVYSNCCDLIVEWAEQQTIMEQAKINLWR